MHCFAALGAASSIPAKSHQDFHSQESLSLDKIDKATAAAMAEKSLNVVIVGGSLSGLFQGIVLKRLGHNVRILERASPDGLREQGAGITAREDIQDYLNTYDRFSHQPYSPGDASIQFINQTGKVTKTWKMQLRMTSWDTLYYRLRANFDGLESDYVDTARTEQQYVGYVAWRGTVVENQVSDETKALFRTWVNYFLHSSGHILVYLIPGKNGSLKPGERLLNYVWYRNYAADSPELHDLMTDTQGRRHRVTMPMGKLRPEISAQQKAHADKILPAAFAEVVRLTKHPFVQCITDASAPRAVFFDGHLILAGDAFCTFRPHMGSSTNQAALHALLLRRTFPRGDIPSNHQADTAFQRTGKTTERFTMEAYESEVIRYATITSLMSVAWGNKNQFSTRVFLGSVFRLALAYVRIWLEAMLGRLTGGL
ncbi:MAG: hypothetical protein Q9207_008345 [Kuettlingeria erythrocarpa]